MAGRKRLSEQILVITGATSGIGLVTARMAAERGARLVLVARDEDALRALTNQIGEKGGEAAYVAADVGVEEDVRRIASEAVARFGRFDTWINNAAVSIYGDLTEIDLADHRRLFETNYWGTVYGSLVAVEHFRDHGGGLINVGSVLSDRSIPKQGAYCASKHAIKGFTDSLRMELEEAGTPISVSLVKPSAIDTPYKEHAKNYLDRAPKNPPPVYAPDAVARAILDCVVKPRRDIVVGGGGAAISYLGMRFPRLTDLVMERTMSRLQLTNQPSGPRDEHSLYAPMGDEGRERGGYPHHVAEWSLYSRALRHPVATGAFLAALAAGAAAVVRNRV